jgi:hypothetical protein
MWNYNGEEYSPEAPPKDATGFVYRITNLDSGMMYIGKKTFWSRRKKTLKGKTKYVTTESDWRSYYGSSKYLNEERGRLGNDKYYREILRICKSKGECSYYEAKLQFEHDVLLNGKYYNESIMCRIHAKHLRNINANSE